jgi:hypothetical protein
MDVSSKETGRSESLNLLDLFMNISFNQFHLDAPSASGWRSAVLFRPAPILGFLSISLTPFLDI